MTQQEKDKWLLDHPGESLPPEDPNPQEPDSNPAPTLEDSPEVKADKAKIQELEKQLLQAGHVIETLKKDKKPPETPATIDEETLNQKIEEGVERALNNRQPDQRLAEAEDKARKILAERDTLLATLRSKQNRSDGSGTGQRQPIKPDLTLTAEEEMVSKRYNILPEEIIKARN